MEYIKDIIKKIFPPPIAIPLTLQIIILGGMMKIGDLSLLIPFDSLKSKVYEKIPILTIATTLALSCLLWLASYSILYLKYRRKLKPKFGVLWDSNKEAYCPADQVPLSDYREYKKTNKPSEYGFLCVKCNNVIYLSHNGQPLKLEDAKKEL